MNWVAWQLADEVLNPWRSLLNNAIPFPFILRDLGITTNVSWGELLERFIAGPAHNLLKSREITLLLQAGEGIILIDGLDEIGDERIRRDLRRAIHDAMNRYPACRWLLTSRIVGYSETPFHVEQDVVESRDSLSGRNKRFVDKPVAALCYVASFNDGQITEFSKKWYYIREEDKLRAERGAGDLVLAVHRDHDTIRLARSKSPYHNGSRPPDSRLSCLMERLYCTMMLLKLILKPSTSFANFPPIPTP